MRGLRRHFQLLVLSVLAGLVPAVDLSAGENRWTSQGPPGGSFDLLAFDPATSATLYGTSGGLLLKSLDAGRTWRRIASPFFETGLTILRVDPRDSATLYAGTHDGVLKSRDGGETWLTANEGIPSSPSSYRSVLGLVLDPASSGIVYVSVFGKGVFRSADEGGTWLAINTGLPSVYPASLAIDPMNPHTLYVGMVIPSFVAPSQESPRTFPLMGGIYKSVDSGESWSATGLLQESIPVLEIDCNDPSVLYAGGSGIFRTDDAGPSWSTTYREEFQSTIRSLTIDSHLPGSVFASVPSTGLLRTVDGGESWQPIAEDLRTTRVGPLLVDPESPKVLYLGSERGGVFKSLDRGESWQSINDGFGGAAAGSVAADPRNPGIVYAGTDIGVFRSVDAGRNWERTGFNGGYVNLLVVDPLSSGTIYAATGGGVLAKSIDDGRTWAELDHRQPNVPYLPQVRDLVVDPDDSQILFAAADPGILRSVDGGRTWTSIDPFGGPPYHNVAKLAIDPRNGSVLYAGTWGGGVIKSVDGGRTWTATALSRGSTSVLELDPQNPDTLYAIQSGDLDYFGGYYKTMNGGRTWSRIEPTVPAPTLKVDPSNSAVLYAGTYGEGVLRSTDSGSTWSRYGAVVRQFARSLSVAGDGSAIYVATDVGVYDYRVRATRSIPFRPASVTSSHMAMKRISERVPKKPQPRVGAQ
jgi:photosystem II stability/assembly factor-like uncharacterized protein